MASGFTVRVPLANWADSGPPNTSDVPEYLGLNRALIWGDYLSSDCSGTPIAGPVSWDGTGNRLPGIRTVLIAPVAGTRTVRYYDAPFVGYGTYRSAYSHAYYDAGSGNFVCQTSTFDSQQLTGIGVTLFDSTALPPDPYRIQ